jgi:hypothetical protein
MHEPVDNLLPFMLGMSVQIFQKILHPQPVNTCSGHESLAVSLPVLQEHLKCTR